MSDRFSNEIEEEVEEVRRARKRRRAAEMKRRKRQQLLMRRLILGIPAILVVVLAVMFAAKIGPFQKNVGNTAIAADTDQEQKYDDIQAEDLSAETAASGEAEEASDSTVYTAQSTDATASFNGEVISSYGILVDVAAGEIVAARNANDRISPASMTKILTVLVAAEHVTDLDDTFTMTIDITDYSFSNDCSNVGFEVGEVLTVRDLFYGTILSSGADAAVGLATYVAGSQEAFVELMNEKLDQLGLSDSAHFTNCVGLYDENHYCTVYDMAMILEAAANNELCREVLSAHTYTTSATAEHPEGITISNWFLRRIEDKDTAGEVLCAKTGYVVQSGNCAASLATDESGKEYICVTANSTSSWKCIYDHVAVYQDFLR